MTLDDLRAQAAQLSADMVTFTSDTQRAAQALTDRAVALSKALDAYTPPPPPPPAVAPVEYALFCYNDPAIDAHRTVQVLQGQPGTLSLLPQLRQAGVKKLYRYSHAVTWTDHPDVGVRLGSDPTTFNKAWLATRNNQWIRSTKFDPGGGYGYYLIDVGNADYQKASAEWLIRLCKIYGWDGAYLDEINEFVDYAGYVLPARYPANGAFQQAQLAYIRYVSNALKAAGFECYVNLASNDNQWRRDVALAVAGTHVEFFMAQWTVNSPDAWHVASLQNGEWQRQLDWVAWNEAQGRTTICQADAKTEAEVNYALTSLLLVANKARFAARKNSSYGVGQGWWTSMMDTAKALGKPLGPYVVLPSGIRQRDFEHGRVSVNPSTSPINTMSATSGLIELR